MDKQSQQGGQHMPPPVFPNTQPPKKKKRIWLWVLITIFAIAILSSIFSDGDKDNKDAKIQSEQVSKKDWTEQLMTDLSTQSEYIDSVIPRAKKTSSTEMLHAYIKDMTDIANKTIKDSLYMDVYKSPEVVKKMNDNSTKANKILPQLGQIVRKQYAESVGDKLWEDNIYVELSNNTKTITFIGGLFASNKNIKNWQEKFADTLKDLGFTQVRYKWIKHDDEYTYYDL